MCKKLFFIVPVLLLVFSASQPAKGDLVAYYPFDGNADDASGNGLNGTAVGDPNYEDGYIGQALRLDGEGQYVDCGNDPLLDINEQITLAAWFKVDEWGSLDALLAKGDDSYRIAMSRTVGILECALSGFNTGGPWGQWGALSAVTDVNDGEWHHIAAACDGSTFNVYIDGVLDASTAVTGELAISEANLWIGNNSQRDTRLWDGWIDEVQIYNNALTADEVALLVAPKPDLAWYKLDGNALDSSGNELHGTPNETVVWLEDAERGLVASFNGTDAAIQTPVIIGAFPQDRDFTWAFLYKYNSVESGGNDCIIGNRGGGDDDLDFIKFTPSQFEYYLDADNNVMLDYADYPEGKWVHNTVVKDANTLTYYRNGIEAVSATVTFDMNDANNPFWIGGDPEAGWGGELAAGEISDVRLYNSALTPDDIALLAGSLGYIPVPDVAWYKLDEGEGDVATDSSDNGYDGVIVNGETGGLGDANSVWLDDPDFGMVASFNGDNSAGAYIDCNMIIPILGPNDSFTWAFWAKQDESQAVNNDVIIGNRYGGDEDLMFIKFTPSQFEFYAGSDSDANIDYNDITADMGWVHHATVKDANSLTYYRNAVALGTSDGSTVTVGDVNPFYIGGDASRERWAGSISDVKLFSYALTEDEVLLISGLSAPVVIPDPEPEPTPAPPRGGGMGGG